MKEYLLVGFGGMIGSIARYASAQFFLYTFPASKFPWGTFFVNIVGCLLMGVLFAYTQKQGSFSDEVRLFGMVGLLGGFTTFSAFGLESFVLFRNGQLALVLIYIFSSIFLGLLATYLGMKFVV